ncbi:hypothetical protein ES702_02628 [subsurface metagenome]
MKVKNKPTNVKPDSWYEEYKKGVMEREKQENFGDLEDYRIYEKSFSMKTQKERDEKVNLFEKIWGNLDKYWDFFNRNNLDEKEKGLLILDDISYDIYVECWKYIKTTDFIHFVEKYNNINKNMKMINHLIYLIPRLKVDKAFRFLHSEYIFRVEKCFEALPQYLVTSQLFDIFKEILEWFPETKDGKVLYRESNLDFKYKFEEPEIEEPERGNNFEFICSEKEVFDLILKEVKWRDKERDIEIYIEREKGRLLEDIAGDYKTLKLKAIGNICTKVKGAIIRYKGKLFEKHYFQYLRSLNKFDRIVWDGSSGKPDIIAYKNNDLYIFSLKNLKIDRKKFVIKKQDLEPEFKRAYNGLLENDNIFLKLVVFDNLTDNVIERKLDFRNPKDVIISS